MIKKWSHILCLSALTIMLAQCAKQKTKQTMALNELIEKADSYMAKNKNEDAIGYLEEIMARFPDTPNIADYKMTLADLYVKEGNNSSAHEMYEHYNQFYPSDTKAEYAKYQALLAMHRQTLKTDCDQTETEEAIRLCKEYLENQTYTAYRNEVATIQREGQERLIDKEVYVFNFYVKQEQFDAAHKRLKHLQEKYASFSEFKPRFLYLACKLAQRQHKTAEVEKTLATLMNSYPDSQFTTMAHDLTTRPKFLF